MALEILLSCEFLMPYYMWSAYVLLLFYFGYFTFLTAIERIKPQHLRLLRLCFAVSYVIFKKLSVSPRGYNASGYSLFTQTGDLTYSCVLGHVIDYIHSVIFFPHILHLSVHLKSRLLSAF